MAKGNKKGQRIRNGALRRDFKRLLEIIGDSPVTAANADDEYAILLETEEIALRNDLYFDDYGAIKERKEGR